MNKLGDGPQRICTQAGDQPTDLRAERKGCDTTEDQASDKDCKPKANATEMVTLRHVYRNCGRFGADADGSSSYFIAIFLIMAITSLRSLSFKLAE